MHLVHVCNWYTRNAHMMLMMMMMMDAQCDKLMIIVIQTKGLFTVSELLCDVMRHRCHLALHVDTFTPDVLLYALRYIMAPYNTV